ncbi:UV DNA damage endonuclease [Deinobacterium chartae]|uniref:UV DNA damage endonuclease n=1 Tax=Deinobacterium chartae TaxID=521158 RepID=A0A841I0Y5_9DEIO|nr:UV DNA damage repair endonuclease UvsE [Deinobacterium chartae]MBB6099451.1 UV DNA damage endonuclease [Deinobacterium chartae]
MTTSFPAGVQLGLVCITRSDSVRFRTLTRTRYLALPEEERFPRLQALYAENLRRLYRALDFCAENDIHLYRMSSDLFPLADLEGSVGLEVLTELQPALAGIGPRAEELGIRLVIHPEQFIVLSSDSPDVVARSIKALEIFGHSFDLMGLPRSAWSPIIVHGGKSGRAERLGEVIRTRLPETVRARLALENDEYAYGPQEILEVCRSTGVPFVYDAHHHAVSARLGSYEDPAVRHFTEAARATWPQPEWQVVHLSNGRESFNDRRHSDFISLMPSAFFDVPWIELEAKAKDEAIALLRAGQLGG